MAPKDLSTRRYTRAQMLRFPVLFGGILGLFLISFKLRKTYFAEEIETVRRKNYEEGIDMLQAMEKAKEEANEEILAKRRAKKTA